MLDCSLDMLSEYLCSCVRVCSTRQRISPNRNDQPNLPENTILSKKQRNTRDNQKWREQCNSDGSQRM